MLIVCTDMISDRGGWVVRGALFPQSKLYRKFYQSYECSPIGLGSALSSRASYTRPLIVMYVNHTSFQRALGNLTLNSRREYLKLTILYSHQKRYQSNFACCLKTKLRIERTKITLVISKWNNFGKWQLNKCIYYNI